MPERYGRLDWVGAKMAQSSSFMRRVQKRSRWMRLMKLSDCLRPRRWSRGYSRSGRSEEHTSELQSLMRISYAVFCLKKKNYKYATIDRQRQTQKLKTHTSRQ